MTSNSARVRWFEGRNDVRVYPSFDDLLNSFPAESTYISVREPGKEPLDFYWDYRGSDRTLVFFHASLARSVARLPVFLGLSVSTDVSANRLFIADPAHYASDDVMIGWFMGTSRWPNYQKLLIGLLAYVQARFGQERIALFGPSAGGYASLFYSSFLAGSIAIPVNPQTDLTLRSDAEIRPLCKFAWDLDVAMYDPFRLVPAAKEVIGIYSRPTSNLVLYVQNDKDSTHVDLHMRPFEAALHPDVTYTRLSADWGPGHVAPPKEFTQCLLTAIAAGTPYSDIPEQLEGISIRHHSR
jgi:hypothetical protein